MKIIIIAAGLAAAAVALSGCEDLETAADPNLSTAPSGSAGAKSGKSGGPGGEPARKDGLHEITYRITGSAERG
ncbi:hypothetical protein ACFQHO_44695 [Actinomadura yumaensis]